MRKSFVARGHSVYRKKSLLSRLAGQSLLYALSGYKKKHDVWEGLKYLGGWVGGRGVGVGVEVGWFTNGDGNYFFSVFNSAEEKNRATRKARCEF